MDSLWYNSRGNHGGRQIILFAEASALLFFVHPYVHKRVGAEVHCGMCFDLNTIISLGPAPSFWQLTPPTPLNFSLQSSCLPNQFNPLMNSSLLWNRLQLTLSLSLCPAQLTPEPESAHSSRASFTTASTTGVSPCTWSRSWVLVSLFFECRVKSV